MIWDDIQEEIYFRNSTICLTWGTELRKLVEIGKPDIVKTGGRVQIIWRDMSLLYGIRGDWMVTTLPPNDMAQPFKKIHINYKGDKDATNAYLTIKNRLLSLLGKPAIQNDEGQDKELKWVNEDSYIRLYLFEMHSFRCELTIGKR